MLSVTNKFILFSCVLLKIKLLGFRKRYSILFKCHGKLWETTLDHSTMRRKKKKTTNIMKENTISKDINNCIDNINHRLSLKFSCWDDIKLRSSQLNWHTDTHYVTNFHRFIKGENLNKNILVTISEWKKIAVIFFQTRPHSSSTKKNTLSIAWEMIVQTSVIQYWHKARFMEHLLR